MKVYKNISALQNDGFLLYNKTKKLIKYKDKTFAQYEAIRNAGAMKKIAAYIATIFTLSVAYFLSRKINELCHGREIKKIFIEENLKAQKVDIVFSNKDLVKSKKTQKPFEGIKHTTNAVDPNKSKEVNLSNKKTSDKQPFLREKQRPQLVSKTKKRQVEDDKYDTLFREILSELNDKAQSDSLRMLNSELSYKPEENSKFLMGEITDHFRNLCEIGEFNYKDEFQFIKNHLLENINKQINRLNNQIEKDVSFLSKTDPNSDERLLQILLLIKMGLDESSYRD